MPWSNVNLQQCFVDYSFTWPSISMKVSGLWLNIHFWVSYPFKRSALVLTQMSKLFTQEVCEELITWSLTLASVLLDTLWHSTLVLFPPLLERWLFTIYLNLELHISDMFSYNFNSMGKFRQWTQKIAFAEVYHHFILWQQILNVSTKAYTYLEAYTRTQQSWGVFKAFRSSWVNLILFRLCSAKSQHM